MVALVATFHGFCVSQEKSWMVGLKPTMTT